MVKIAYKDNNGQWENPEVEKLGGCEEKMAAVFQVKSYALLLPSHLSTFLTSKVSDPLHNRGMGIVKGRIERVWMEIG